MKKLLVPSFIQLFILFLPYWVAAQELNWEKAIGGSANDAAYDMIITSDQGYAFTGHSESTDGDVTDNKGGWDVFVVRLDKNHNLKWQKTYGGSENDLGRSIRETPEHGFIVVGSSYSGDFDLTQNHGSVDYWIFEVDSNGNLIWQKSYGGSGEDQAYEVALTNDSGYLIAGYSGSTNGDVLSNHGSDDFWILKLNSLGGIVWQKSYGGTGRDIPYAMTRTIDGGALIAGKSNSTDGDVTTNRGAYDIWIIKIDSLGEIQWEKSFGGSLDDIGLSLLQTSNLGYVIGGITKSSDGDITQFHGGMWDSWVIKIDVAGNFEWQKTYGGSNDEAIEAGIIEVQGNYILAGWTGSYDGDVSFWHGSYDFWLIMVDDSGSIVWEKTYGGMLTEQAMACQKAQDGNIIIAGGTYSVNDDISFNHGGMDMWVISITNMLETESILDNDLVQVFPNPASSIINICIDIPAKHQCIFSLFNILGDEVLRKELKNGNNNISIIEFSRGIYFYSIDSKSNISKGKIIISGCP